MSINYYWIESNKDTFEMLFWWSFAGMLQPGLQAAYPGYIGRPGFPQALAPAGYYFPGQGMEILDLGHWYPF